MPKLLKSKVAAIVNNVARLTLHHKEVEEIAKIMDVRPSTVRWWYRKYDERIAQAIDKARMQMTQAVAKKGAQRFYEALAMEGETQEIQLKQAELARKTAERMIPEWRHTQNVVQGDINIAETIVQNEQKQLEALNKFAEFEIVENGTKPDPKPE